MLGWLSSKSGDRVTPSPGRRTRRDIFLYLPPNRHDLFNHGAEGAGKTKQKADETMSVPAMVVNMHFKPEEKSQIPSRASTPSMRQALQDVQRAAPEAGD